MENTDKKKTAELGEAQLREEELGQISGGSSAGLPSDDVLTKLKEANKTMIISNVSSETKTYEFPDYMG